MQQLTKRGSAQRPVCAGRRHPSGLRGALHPRARALFTKSCGSAVMVLAAQPRPRKGHCPGAMWATLACVLLLAGYMACSSAMPVKKAHKNRRRPARRRRCRRSPRRKPPSPFLAPWSPCPNAPWTQAARRTTRAGSARWTRRRRLPTARRSCRPPEPRWPPCWEVSPGRSFSGHDCTGQVHVYSDASRRTGQCDASRRAGQCGEGFAGSSSSEYEACSPGKFMSCQGSVMCSGFCPCGSHGPSSGSFSDGPGNTVTTRPARGSSQFCMHITISFASQAACTSRSLSTESGFRLCHHQRMLISKLCDTKAIGKALGK